jgi:hypothetical protein
VLAGNVVPGLLIPEAGVRERRLRLVADPGLLELPQLASTIGFSEKSPDSTVTWRRARCAAR